jgi:hypothetical protein
MGLTIRDMAVLVSKNGPFTLPSKPQLDKEGRQKMGIDVKATYVPAIEWRTRDLADGFSAAMVELVQRAHPDALNGGE